MITSHDAKVAWSPPLVPRPSRNRILCRDAYAQADRSRERLGHSGVAITLDLYSHVSIHMQAEAAELVAGPLLRAAGEGPA